MRSTIISETCQISGETIGVSTFLTIYGAVDYPTHWSAITVADPFESCFLEIPKGCSPMPVVKFIKEKKEIEVPQGANLRKEAIRAGVNLYPGINGFGASINKYANCHGWGQCGMCRVNIVNGMENASEMGIMEKARLRIPIPTPVTPLAFDPIPAMAYLGHEGTMRLACQVSVQGDMEVETGPELDLYGENFFS